MLVHYRFLFFTFYFLFFAFPLNAAVMEEGALIKEKNEIIALKKELNEFYNQKENEYKKRKAELESLLGKIQAQKREIQEIYDKNKAILKDIEGAVTSKTSRIYNSMKPKVAAAIFDKMIKDGKIDDVFDIIVNLKEKKVTLLMKFLDVNSAATLTKMLKDYNISK